MMAGRSPVCACPGPAGMSTRQISPFFMGLRLFRELFDRFDGAGARAIPIVKLFLQFRRHRGPDRLQADFNACPFRQRRIGNDDAVGHDARDSGGHGFLLPTLIVTRHNGGTTHAAYTVLISLTYQSRTARNCAMAASSPSAASGIEGLRLIPTAGISTPGIAFSRSLNSRRRAWSSKGLRVS